MANNIHMLFTQNISEEAEFKALNRLVTSAIKREYQINSISELEAYDQEWLNNKKVDLRDDTDLMLAIENELKPLINSLGFRADFMQFPCNTRILLPENNKNYKNLPYNVDSIHCDPWSGSPKDSLNCYLYIHKELDSPTLKFYTYDDVHAKVIKSYSGHYLNSPKIEYQEIVENIMPSLGTIHIFSCFVPHAVARNSKGVTISVDFRLRNLTSEFMRDLETKTKDAWSSSKMTSLGVYWKWSSSRHSTFKDKVEKELELDPNIPQQYNKLKSKYIRNFYSI